MHSKAVTIWEEVEKLVQSQKINKEKVAARGYGCMRAQINLRRAANDIRLLSEHFRAITRKPRFLGDLESVSRIHEARWNKRQVKGKR